MDATIVVTGGAGFIGSCFVRMLIEKTAAKVIHLDKLTYAGNLNSLPNADGIRHSFQQGDICDGDRVAQLLTAHRPDAVVHFAAESHVDRSIDGPREFVRTNVQGTFELLRASLQYWRDLPALGKKRFRFLHVSTDEVYGSLGDTGKFIESTPYDPHSPTLHQRRQRIILCEPFTQRTVCPL